MKRLLLGLLVCLAAALLVTGSAAFGDTTPPLIVRVSVSHPVISAGDAGRLFVVTVVFSEPVNGIGPMLTFDPNLGSLLTLDSSGWIDPETFQAAFRIGSPIACILGVDIIIDGTLEDAAGNDMALPLRVRRAFSFDGGMVATPAGDADESFLDRAIVLAEGEAPPIVGYRRLMATYALGEPITGAVILSTCAGRPLDSDSVVVELSALDLSARPYTSEQVSYTRVRYDKGSGRYKFVVDTTELSAGYYDLRLAFPDSTYVRLRIELTKLAP